MTSIHIPPDLPFPSVRRVRLMAYLFRQAHIRIKEPCLKCARPFIVERLDGSPDRHPYCPDCLPRPDGTPNAALYCDCGNPAVVAAYISIQQPGIARPASHPIPLCEICSIEELLSRLKNHFSGK
jgi:hypothetical protein